MDGARSVESGRGAILPWPALAGIALMGLYERMVSVMGLGVPAFGQYALVSSQQAMFWLAHLLFATPATLLLGYALAPRIGPSLMWAWRARTAPSRRHDWVDGGLFLGLLFALAWGGRQLVLSALPASDAEAGLDWASRLWRSGSLWMHLPAEPRYFYLAETYRVGRAITSLEAPGAIGATVLADRTGHADTVHALWAAMAGVFVADAADRLGGRKLAVIAALLWLFSPAVFLPSMTHDAETIARTFVAAAFSAWARAASEPGGPRARQLCAFSVAAAGAVLVRPEASAALLVPLLLHLGWRVHHGGAGSRVPGWFSLALPLVAGLLVLGLYDHAITGHAWVLPWRGVGAFPHAHRSATVFAAARLRLASRLGVVVGFDTAMFAIWFLGPLGALLPSWAVFATSRTDRRLHLLTASVVACIAVLAVRRHAGTFALGPVALASACVPATLLGAAGFLHAVRSLAALGLDPRPLGSVLPLYLAGALGGFTLSHAVALREQTDNQLAARTAAEHENVHHAVVALPAWDVFFRNRGSMATLGALVLRPPAPGPRFDDDVLYVRADTPRALLERTFPGRTLLRARYLPFGPTAEFVPLQDIRAGTAPEDDAPGR